MKKKECFKDTGKQFKTKTASKTAKPLTMEEVEKQLRSGKLTWEQAIELRQRYMDSLEYEEDPKFVTCCSGIQPLPPLPPMDEEDRKQKDL